MLATGRVIGQSLSVALAGTLLAAQAHHLPASKVAALQNTFVNGFHYALLLCAGFAALGILTALVRGDENKQAKQPSTTSRAAVS